MMSRVTALVHLQEYVTQTESGHADLKSCLWQLTKSRRNKNRGMLSLESSFRAGEVREEFEALTLLGETEAPDLIAEEEIIESSSSSPGSWKLLDVAEERMKDKEKKENIATKKAEGLRQRKNTKKQKEKESKTVKETHDKEEHLDPLELFGGFAPRELKLAQQKAKKALESYVQAANEAIAILEILQEEKTISS